MKKVEGLKIRLTTPDYNTHGQSRSETAEQKEQ
jgi:hypothetical protein